MASSNPNPNPNNKNKNKLSSSLLLLSGREISDQTTTTTTTNASYTTFVQADPSNFRAVVQSLTGSTQLHPSSTQKLPFTIPAKPSSGEMGPRRPGFKLHERRKSAKKLEMIKLNNRVGSSISGSPRQREFGGEMMMMVSPVSTLDLFTRGSPKSPLEEEEEERAIIAEKGFYLHPRSPLSTPRGGSELQLLPLFPLHSPTK